jgi:competence protein ComEC
MTPPVVGRIVCHVLLCELPDRLVLVDTGFGTADVADPAGRLGPARRLLRARLASGETAVRQVEALGFAAGDVRDIVLTHFDLDHVGGAEAVIGRADRVLTGPTDGADDERLRAAFAAAGAVVEQVEIGDRGVLGELEWQVLWPPPRGVTPGNPASVTLDFSCPQHACLEAIMLGDLGEESQARLMGAADPGRVDVVKVAHHGSADQSAAFYERLDATVGLIGVGADNDYGHPTDKLLGILASTGTTALRTDLDGLILLAPGDTPGAIDVWTSR